MIVEQSQLLTPFQSKLLLKRLNTESRPAHRRRIEIMLLADAGKSQAEICAQLGCSQATARHWMTIAREGKAHSFEDCPVGHPQMVNDQYLDRLKELASHSPRDYGYPFKRWTAGWLSKHLAEELGIEISDRHINRLLKKMGLSTRAGASQEALLPVEPKTVEITIQDLQPEIVPDLLLINPIEVHP